ncbi:tyrosine-type recombinase/integrase [Nocardia sp. CA-151230]|uniref:tyrosine-type recombinase/integrase n=1 Tax=Nocardia sp. CA-151230 TaxID=3239982 RepID=UPI003D8F9460
MISQFSISTRYRRLLARVRFCTASRSSAAQRWPVRSALYAATSSPGHKGGFLTSTEFRWVFDRAAKDTGLIGVVPHGLRRTAASPAISAGTNIKVVQRMLGHKTVMLTLDLYGHLFPDDPDAVANGMEAGAQAAVYRLRTGIKEGLSR